MPPTLTLQQPLPPPSPSGSSPRSGRHIPLLSLAPPALALGADLTLGEPGDDANVGEIWNVITRAADLVKDGERLENLAWRHWARPKRTQVPCRRRTSTSSAGTASTLSIATPPPDPPRTFGGALKLLLEDDSNFKDWVSEAKRLPVVSVPDTPVADVEIRLLEPTPVPSRVGSLGASLVGAGSLFPSPAAVAAPIDEEEVIDDLPESLASPQITSRRRGKFFVHSSPSKGSGSESSHPSPHPSPNIEQRDHSPKGIVRDSSDSNLSGSKLKKTRIADVVNNDRPKRNVSLSTMRGRFAAEKRRAAEAIAAKEEDSGWEDDDEGEGEDVEEEEAAVVDDEGWSDESDQEPEPPVEAQRRSSRSRSGRSASNLDLTTLLTRVSSRRSSKPAPPPPAPTPLKKMSKKERQAAAAERARIEAELEAQRKREMFAKQQIFGRTTNGSGLSGLFKSGGSMIDLVSVVFRLSLTLQTQAESARGPLRPSPTHGHLPSLVHSGPSLLRSKSAVAVPVQTGVSVTSQHHAETGKSARSGSKSSQERRPPEGVEMESSDEDSEAEENPLANSQTQKRLEEMIAKREAKALPVPNPVRFDNPVGPVSPTTRRRTIIMREMSESLRKNLVLEREKSAGATRSYTQSQSRPPSMLPTRSSAQNLPQIQDAPLPRRTNSGILGGGFLKPLTRVGQAAPAVARTQSYASLTSSPKSPDQPLSEPPAMMRSSTEGGGSSRDARRKELAMRAEKTDTSYRSHGW